MNNENRNGWELVLPNVELYRDSCNVYAVSQPGGTIFINAGTGRWLDNLPARFNEPHTLLCTHYFRDHAAGAAKASRRRIVQILGRELINLPLLGSVRKAPQRLRASQRGRLA